MLLFRNIRSGAQGLRHNPGFALAAVLTLAMGIGLSTAVFTVADALLLRPLPVRDQNRIVVVTGERRDGRAGEVPFRYADAHEFVVRTRSLTDAALFGYEGAAQNPVRDGERILPIRRALVSGNYFSVLGTRALLGRTLRAADDVRGAVPVLVLSHRAWEQFFAGDPHVLGRRVVTSYGGAVYTVVGVMPEGLEYPRGVDAWAAILPATPESVVPLLAYEVIGRRARLDGEARGGRTDGVLPPPRRTGGGRHSARGCTHTAGAHSWRHPLEKFGFREFRHRPNIAVRAAVCLAVGARRKCHEKTPLQPRPEMLRDPETEWALYVTGVTRDFGFTVATPWGPIIGLRDRLDKIQVAPLDGPYDVLDGMLALPLPRESAR